MNFFPFAGDSITFEVGSWLEENSRLYEQGAIRPLNLGGSGGSEMPFPAFWAPNVHASTSGNYSVCMAIRCEINVKEKSFFNFNLRY